MDSISHNYMLKQVRLTHKSEFKNDISGEQLDTMVENFKLERIGLQINV